MTFGRFGMVALVHADEQCLNRMLENEHKRFYNDRKKIAALKEARVINMQTDSPSDAKNLNLGDEKEATLVGNGQTDLPETKSEVLAEGSTDSKIIPTNAVPTPFRDNAVLRAAVSSVLLYFGYPFIGNGESTMRYEISPNPLFGTARFESLLQGFCGSTKIPKIDVIKEYIEGWFLPHCLKLCLYGNSATTRITRGSKGEYETSDGTSSYPEPTGKLQSPLPDPCLPLVEQSIEAVGMASAIIRRVRLMRCILNISSGQIQTNKLEEILHSPTMRKSMDGLPIWWCPWIHDTALLAHASTRGLFSILKDLESESGCEAGPIFSREAIQQHIKFSFFADESIARSMKGASSPDDTVSWIESYADEFPSLNVIERRLAFLCAKATEDLENESRFENLPMYDHGGWPRN